MRNTLVASLRLILVWSLAFGPTLSQALAAGQTEGKISPSAVATGFAQMPAMAPSLGVVGAGQVLSADQTQAAVADLTAQLSVPGSNQAVAMALAHGLESPEQTTQLSAFIRSAQGMDPAEAARIAAAVDTLGRSIQAHPEALKTLGTQLATTRANLSQDADAALASIYKERAGATPDATPSVKVSAPATPAANNLAHATAPAPKAAASVTGEQAGSQDSAPGLTPWESRLDRWTRGYPFLRPAVLGFLGRREAARVETVEDPKNALSGLMQMTPKEIDALNVGGLAAAMRPFINLFGNFDRAFAPIEEALNKVDRDLKISLDRAESEGRFEDIEGLIEGAKKARAPLADQLWPLAHRFGIKNLSASPLTAIFRTFMDTERWRDMVILYDESVSRDFRNSDVNRQFLTVALSKLADKSRKSAGALRKAGKQEEAAVELDRANQLLDRAERILLSVPTRDLRGEDYGLLGKINKLRYQDAMERAEASGDAATRKQALAHLQTSIDLLRKGFLQGFEHYPGINLVLNLFTMGEKTGNPALIAEARRLAKLVYFAAEKAGGVRSSDFWTLSTLYQAAVIAGDMNAQADSVIRRIGIIRAPDWQVDSTLSTLNDLKNSLIKIGVAPGSADMARIDAGIAALKSRGRVGGEKASTDPEVKLAEDVMGLGFSLGEIPSGHVGGNIEFGGQLHHTLVNRWDFAVGREILDTLGLRSPGVTFEDFNERVPKFLRSNYGIPALESLHGEAHKTFDARMKRLLRFMLGRLSNGLTNKFVDTWLRLGDCRPTGADQQILFDLWKTDQINDALAKAYAHYKAGDERSYALWMKEAKDYQDTYMLTMDANIQAEVAMEKAYKPTLKNGLYVRTDGAKTLEDHTLNILVKLETREDGTRVFKELRLVDSWYNIEFRFGGSFMVDGKRIAGIKVPRENIRMITRTDPKTGKESPAVQLVVGTVNALDPATGGVSALPLALIKAGYGGDAATKSGGIGPNRRDFGKPVLRGTVIDGVRMVNGRPDVRSFFDDRYTRALHALFDRIVAWGETLDRQNFILTVHLKSKQFAREIAQWADAQYYKALGKPVPPLLTAEEEVQLIEKRFVDEQVAMELAAVYAVETGVAWLANATGRPIKLIYQEIVNGTLPDDDMMKLGRFANAAWKAGQPLRDNNLDRIERPVFKAAADLEDAEVRKDFGAIRAAAEKMLENIGTAEGQAVLDKIDALLKNPVVAREMAEYIRAAYFTNQGKVADPFITTVQEHQTMMKRLADERIGQNLAGLYAIESAIGILAESRGLHPMQILAAFTEGRYEKGVFEEKDMDLLRRIANGTWKSGQPFRETGLARIKRPVMTPFDKLSDAEKAKDDNQLRSAGRLLFERMSRHSLTTMDVVTDGKNVSVGGQPLFKESVWQTIASAITAQAKTKMDAATAERIEALLAQRDKRHALAFWGSRTFPDDVATSLERALFRKSKEPRRLVVQASIEGDNLVIRLAENEAGLVGMGKAPLSVEAVDQLLSTPKDESRRAPGVVFAIRTPLIPVLP